MGFKIKKKHLFITNKCLCKEIINYLRIKAAKRIFAPPDKLISNVEDGKQTDDYCNASDTEDELLPLRQLLLL